MTPHERMLTKFPHVVVLPDKPGGLGFHFDAMHRWLKRRMGVLESNRWDMLGSRIYFRDEVDCLAFCHAWGVVRE